MDDLHYSGRNSELEKFCDCDKVFENCCNYVESTTYQIPQVCAVCSRQRDDIDMKAIPISAGANIPSFIAHLRLDEARTIGIY